MVAFLYYPIYLVLFWYSDVLLSLFSFFGRFNIYLASLLSLGLLVKTFFKPLKNEYRDGLVLFSIFFGIAIKSVLISVILGIFIVTIAVECLIGMLVAFLPIGLLLILLGASSPVWYE